MAALLFGISVLFWIFLSLTAAAPGLVGGDAPELATAAFHLGSAHAPGYPLFVIFGRIFELLPVGAPAFRLTFFSILAQTAAYCVTVFTLKDMIRVTISDFEKWGIAILTSCLVFAGPLVFHQTVSPEVFALHFLFVALLLRLVLFPTTGNFYLSAFFSGLALSHQHLTLLILPALFLTNKSYLRKSRFLILGTCLFLLGLSPYLLLTLRAVQNPAANWGNPHNFHQLFYHLTRAQYGGDITKGSFLNGLWDLYLYVKTYAFENLGIGLLLVLTGFFIKRSSFKWNYFSGVLCLLVALPFLIRAPYDPENNFVNKAFLPPTVIWLSPLLLKGVEWLYENAQKARAFLLVLLTAFTVFLAGNSYQSNHFARNLAVEDISRDILMQMPVRSVLFSEGDAVTFPLAYLHLVRGLRPDLEIFDRTGGLFKDLYHLLDYRNKIETPPNEQLVEIEKEFENKNKPTAVFYTEKTTVPGRTLAMVGLLFKVVDEASPAFSEQRLWDLYVPPRIQLIDDYLSRETGARYYIFKATYELERIKNTLAAADDLGMTKKIAFDNSRVLVNAGVLENANGWTDQAAQTFERACDLTPQFYLAWLDRGIAAGKQQRLLDAVEYFQKSINCQPDLAETHHHLAYQYYLLKRFPDAIREWETTRRLEPTFADAYRNLAFVYLHSKPDYAAEMFTQYLRLIPNPPDKAVIDKFMASQQRH